MLIRTDFNKEECRLIDIYNEFPPYLRAIHFAGIGGVCTAGQLFRFLQIHEPNEKECMRVILFLIGMGFISKLPTKLQKRINSELTKNRGTHGQHIIFYLTLGGFNEIKRLSLPAKLAQNQSDRITQQVKFGLPRGIKLYRVLHELLVAESLLYWYERYHLIWIKTENQAKGEYYKLYQQKRRAFKLSEMPPAPTSYADYELYCLDRETGEFYTFSCEICIRMDKDQIRNKSNHYYWFCLTEIKARLINEITGSSPVVLDDLFSPQWVEGRLWGDYYTKNAKEFQQNRVFGIIEELGGVVSSRLLTAEGIKSLDYYRRKLEELHEQKLLRKVAYRLPGSSGGGRNENYYSVDKLDIENNAQLRYRGALRCRVITTALRDGYTVEYCGGDDAVLLEQDEMFSYVMLDDPFAEIEENLDRLNQCSAALMCGGVLVACADEEREALYACRNERQKFFKF